MIVKTDSTDLLTPTGPMRVRVFVPDDTAHPYPGLLLYSEIFQITPPIARLATQYASHGYVVMVPEIYHEHEPAGTVISYDDAGKKKGNDYKIQTKLSTFDADAGVVIRALKMDPLCNGRVGTVGFCIGGHLAFRAALHPEVRAAACFYPTDLHSGTLGVGKKADTLARAKEIRGEVLMIFGRQDPHVPLEGRVAIHEQLNAANVRFTWHEFNCAHAFMRDEDERHDPQAARACMGLSLDLFKRAL
jgi:carboxymethylenebutenolidase